MNALDETFLRSLDQFEIAVARLRAGAADGGRRAGRRGGRVEFSEHRPYSAGDDVRTIDWSAEARTGRLYVKEFERDEDLDVVLVVDASASMSTAGKFESAQRLAYALGWIALRSGGRVRVAVATGGALAVGDEATGPVAAARLRAALLRIAPGGTTQLSASLARVPVAGRGTRLVILLSDLLAEDDGRRALTTLAERGDDVVVLHVRAAADLAAGDDEAVLLEDAETGERVAPDVHASERARAFAVRNEEDWRAFAARHGVRYVPVDAAAPLDATAVRALRAAGVLT